MTSASLYLSSIKTYSTRGTYLSLGGYGTTSTLSTNDATHSDTVSAYLDDSILSFSGGNIPITVYVSQSTTANQINYRDGCTLTLTVNYSEPSTASTGSLSASSVALGSSITLYISASSSSMKHTAVWSLGSYSQSNSVAAGVTSSAMTIPTDWASAVTGSTATGKVILYTYNSAGTLIGSNTYSFTVTLPASMAPAIGSFTATHINGTVPAAWGVYVQGKSKVQLTIGGAASSTGASISTFKITGGGYSFSSATETSYTTGFLTSAETITFTGSVTDSRGLTASKTVTVTVQPYAAPSISQVSAFRCLSTGVASETGGYVNVTVNAEYATVGGKNTLALSVQHRQIGAGVWSSATAVTNGAAKIVSGLFPEPQYEMRVLATDAFSSVERIVDVASAQYTMHFARGGLNVSIGKAGTRQNALEIDPNWKIYHGDVDVMAKFNGVKPITEGGTGATTAAAALTNLGAAASSHNHSAANITSGTLPVARGGTGATALTASRALVSDGSGNVAVSAVTSTQLGYLSGVTSAIQTQLNAKPTIKIARGTASINGNTGITINYSGAGFTSVPSVAVTYSTTGANWSGDNGAIKVYSKTTTSAGIVVGGSFATNRDVDWIAIGT